jgi:hypothetical protein
MTEPRRYLRLRLDGTDYLLPGDGCAIEPRAQLLEAAAGEFPVAAWRARPDGRCPAYSLGAELRAQRPGRWTAAVFLEAAPRPLGLVCEEGPQWLERAPPIEPFTPPGPPPTFAGHLFAGAWVEGVRPVLVFEPPALIAHLQGLGTKA